MSSLVIHDDPGTSFDHWPRYRSFEVTQGHLSFLLNFANAVTYALNILFFQRLIPCQFR